MILRWKQAFLGLAAGVLSTVVLTAETVAVPVTEAPVEAADKPAPRQIRVVTWNIEWFPGGKPKATPEEEAAQIEAVQTAIAEMNPDILFMQEIRDLESAKLAVRKVPGLEVAVCSTFQGTQQLVIASKFPVEAAWSEEFKKGTGKDNPPRGFDFAAIRLPGEEARLLMAYTFHFKSNRGSDKPSGMRSNIAKREAGSKQLAAHIQDIAAEWEKKGKLSWILAGDFNTSLDDARFKDEQTMRALQKGGLKWVFEGMPEEERITLPAEGPYPAITFDHMLYRDLDLASVSVPITYAAGSDHRPVLALFTLPQEVRPTAEELKAKPADPAPATPEAQQHQPATAK